MARKHLYYVLILAISCIEPIQLESIGTNPVLVIDASLTDEMKAHVVTLSYTTSIESTGSSPVQGATIWIEDQDEQQIFFQQTNSGTYETSPDFEPEYGNTYTLYVNLSNGDSYVSDPETLLPEASLDSIYGRYVTLPSTVDATVSSGIQIFVDAHDPMGNISWFRYEWENTFEIITPFRSTAIYNLLERRFEMRIEEVHHCYGTERATSTILGTTQGLTELRISELPIRFLHEDSVYLRTKYSINVKQYSINSNAYQYYKRLKENNEGSGTFFDMQKGVVLGNVHAVSSTNEVVLGYFEVASVDEERVFFTSDDFSNQDFETPDYPYCHYFERGQDFSRPELWFFYSSWVGKLEYFDSVFHADFNNPHWTFTMFPVLCVNCTELGTIEKPEYWED